MTVFGKIPKIVGGINGFSPTIVENYVDIVDKIPSSFPQRDVENEICNKISFFGYKWKLCRNINV